MRIVALDLGLRTTDWCEVKDGVVIARGRVGGTEELFEKHRALTETRKRLVTHARGLARGRGIQLPSCATDDFAVHLRESRLPEPLHSLLEPLIPPIEHVTYQLAAVDLEVQQLCEAGSDPVLDRLASVPGVSVLSAAAFMSVIDDVRRFRHASDVVAYIGLCPSERSSGGKQRLGAITKRGNSYVRWMLVQSAWCILRRRDGDPLSAWGQVVAKRRGRMRAAVAVARRLARVLFSLWRDGTYYDPKTFSADKWSSVEQAAGRQQVAATRAKAKLERQRRTRQRTPEPVATQEVNT